MMKYKYSGNNLEQCLLQAKKELNVDEKDIKYKIIKEIKGVFKKHCEIEVEINEIENINAEINKPTDDEEHIIEEVSIEDNILEIHSDKEREVKVEFNDKFKVKVNDIEVKSGEIIKTRDKIFLDTAKILAKREMNLVVSEDRMSCTLTTLYKPEFVAVFKAELKDNILRITLSYKEDKMPNPFTKEEIKEALFSKGIVSGIDDEILDEIIKSVNVKDMVVASGREAVNDIEDEIKVNFEAIKRNVSERSIAKIDYKNLYSIANVSSGDIIGEYIEGKDGEDGIDIYGKLIKRNRRKGKVLKVGTGCEIKDNRVIAVIDGRPSIKNGVFSVNKVLQTTSDVDIKSGNINFIGDVEVSGSVKEGMLVQSGNSVLVKGSVETAKIIAQGETWINEKILNSQIIAGAKNLDMQIYLETLQSLNEDIKQLVEATKQLIEGTGIGASKPVGEVIKLLIETKYTQILRKSLVVASMGKNNDELVYFLREKIIGSKSLNIKYTNELYDLIECMECEIKSLEEEIIIPVNVTFSYSQDSTVKATGDIFISGKGQYISNLTAGNSIEFIEDGSVCRGGILIAGNGIKAKMIGSIAGVTTVLKTSKDGVITADVVYQNTILYFGERQYIFETPSKQVKAYMGKDGDIIVEKFIL